MKFKYRIILSETLKITKQHEMFLHVKGRSDAKQHIQLNNEGH